MKIIYFIFCFFTAAFVSTRNVFESSVPTAHLIDIDIDKCSDVPSSIFWGFDFTQPRNSVVELDDLDIPIKAQGKQQQLHAANCLTVDNNNDDLIPESPLKENTLSQNYQCNKMGHNRPCTSPIFFPTRHPCTLMDSPLGTAGGAVKGKPLKWTNGLCMRVVTNQGFLN